MKIEEVEISSDEETFVPKCDNVNVNVQCELALSSGEEDVISIVPRVLRCPPIRVMLGPSITP